MAAKRRFNSEADILAAITRCHANALKNVLKANDIAAECEKLRNDPAVSGEYIAGRREVENKHRKRAYELTNVIVRRLGEKLAVIRTPQIPALDNHDPSIPQ